MIVTLTPLGQIANSHVTPTDHTYCSHDQLNVFSPTYDVMAPVGGLVVELGTMSLHLRPGSDDPPDLMKDWRLVICHSCTVSTIYIHLRGIALEILDSTGDYREGAARSHTILTGDRWGTGC